MNERVAAFTSYLMIVSVALNLLATLFC